MVDGWVEWELRAAMSMARLSGCDRAKMKSNVLLAVYKPAGAAHLGRRSPSASRHRCRNDS